MYGNEPEILCYGCITEIPSMKAFLSLPSKFRIFSKKDTIQAKKKTEESAPADRWDFQDGQEREEDRVRLSLEELRRQKDE